MARALLAGMLVVLLAASPLASLASSDDGSVQAKRFLSDGSLGGTTRARLVDVPVPALAGPMDQDQSGGNATVPDVSADLEAEKQRATKEITFYGHVFGTTMLAGQRGDGTFGPDGPQPANTIFPKGDGNLGLGIFDWCSDVVSVVGLPPQPSPWSNCDTDPLNKLALFLTAGPVQVHSRDDFDYSKLHNERGRTKDVVLDKAGQIKAWLWMSLDPVHSWSVGNGGDDTLCIVHLPPDVGCPYPYWGWDPAFYPQWVVEAKLYSVELGEYGQGASEPPPLFESWSSNAMTLIAQGATAPADIQNGLPGQPNVHEFEVNLGNPLVEVIPKTHDMILVYSWYSVATGSKVSTHAWRVWAGELFPARFTLPVKNAIDVELVIPQFVHDKLLIHGVLASAWGSYDVDVASAKVTVLDSGQRPVEMKTLTRVGDYQVAHGAHFKPVNVTWIWDYKADRLAPGTYKVLVEACNFQHSACETTEAAFTLNSDLRPSDIVVGHKGQKTVSEGQLQQITGGGATTQALEPTANPVRVETKGAPGFEALALLGAVAGVALAARRRWAR